MGLYLGGFIIKRIFASEVCDYFQGKGGALIITILRYRRAVATTSDYTHWVLGGVSSSIFLDVVGAPPPPPLPNPVKSDPTARTRVCF